jgi:hypothetical protein
MHAMMDQMVGAWCIFAVVMGCCFIPATIVVVRCIRDAVRSYRRAGRLLAPEAATVAGEP